MPQYASAFRDFGILPPGLLPPSEKIRSFFSTGRVIGQYIGTGIVSAIGLGLIVLIAMIVPTPLNLLGSAAVLMGFGAFIYLATHNDYRWVELEGTTLRAKHLYTGWIIERQVAEIESLRTMVYQIRRIETVVIEHLLGRVKGIEIRFRDGRTPLRILRADPAMTNARELIEAVVFRMGELREIDAEIVDFNGQPLARSVHWKGKAPRKATGQNLKLTLGCFMGIALLFGAILAFWGSGEQKLYVLGSVPPQEISVRSLIQNGLGANRHVTLTDFRPGGYSFETQSGPWTNVWIALFPSGAPAKEGDEIKVVISSNAVRDEPDLRRLLQHGRVTGICSPAPRSSWGATLGPELLKANPGCGLSSAWSIEELRELPSKEQINHLFAGSAACFVVVIAFALIIWSR